MVTVGPAADAARRAALDTNVLARYLMRATRRRSNARHDGWMESGAQFFVPVSVGLELAWILRAEGASKPEILAAFRHLHGLPGMDWLDADVDVLTKHKVEKARPRAPTDW